MCQHSPITVSDGHSSANDVLMALEGRAGQQSALSLLVFSASPLYIDIFWECLLPILTSVLRSQHHAPYVAK